MSEVLDMHPAGLKRLRSDLLGGTSHDSIVVGQWFAAQQRAEWKRASKTKEAFEQHIRALRRPDVGDEADELTEADFASELAEDGWPDHGKWLAIFCRIHDGGELTAWERQQALAYWHAGEDLPPPKYRLPADVT